MDEDGIVTVYNSHAMAEARKNQFAAKVDKAKKLRGGTILEITNVQAKFAEEAGVSCIKISASSSQSLSDPGFIREIQHAVSIPVMAEVRGGHVAEAQMLEALGVDFILEGEQIVGVGEDHSYINKHNFKVPFVCRCQSLEEALARAAEGAAMVWTSGKVSFVASLLPGNFGIIDTVHAIRSISRKIRNLAAADEDQVMEASRKMAVPYEMISEIKDTGKLPVVNFAFGDGIRSPVDAALMMQLGSDGVVIRNEIFNLLNPRKRVRGIVDAVRHFNDPNVLLEASIGLEDPFAEA